MDAEYTARRWKKRNISALQTRLRAQALMELKRNFPRVMTAEANEAADRDAETAPPAPAANAQDAEDGSDWRSW
jgi:hypothetical protein